ncbi:HPr kinase/phosphorylase [Afifella pfennigii]|uniref:HPr kinase/phosphorylase n=1 Tax=Afifella pfennigii TaxID=209897 RepID=UPI000550711F|nr:hypothetical protein [Afifella pfennigii]
MTQRIHASCVVLAGKGVLIRGASGSGKSSLAFAIIEAGGRLLADDYCDLSVCSGRLVATPPAATAGLLELRGRGLLRLPHERAAVIRLLVDLVGEAQMPRMPEPEDLKVELLGVKLCRQPVPARSPLALALVGAAFFVPDGARLGLAT